MRLGERGGGEMGGEGWGRDGRGGVVERWDEVAAVKIQAGFRGYQTRRQVKDLK